MDIENNVRELLYNDCLYLVLKSHFNSDFSIESNISDINLKINMLDFSKNFILDKFQEKKDLFKKQEEIYEEKYKNILTKEDFYRSLFKNYANFSQNKIDKMIEINSYTKCYKLMYGIPVGINAQKILELGIGNNAISTYIFCEALNLTGGHLTSIEINPQWGYNLLPEINRDRWTVICGDSIAVEVNDTFDIIMIDTSHTQEQTEKELKKYIPMLKRDGFLYMHDTNEIGVSNALKIYMENNPCLESFYVEDVEQGKAQLTILRKL